MSSAKKFGIVTIVGLLLLLFLYLASKDKMCRNVPYLAISTIEYGLFIEFIPQTGYVKLDSIFPQNSTIKVTIDELYFSRMKVGLEAITQVNSAEFNLKIVNIDSVLENGRFNVDMKFMNEFPPNITNRQNLRMRIYLGDPSYETLLPLGPFLKYTRGNWIYVMTDSTRAVKREIKLGRKNTEHFVVLDGLKEGDRVITQWPGEYPNDQSIDISDFVRSVQQ
jgi:hypothetical protein